MKLNITSSSYDCADRLEDWYLLMAADVHLRCYVLDSLVS